MADLALVTADKGQVATIPVVQHTFIAGEAIAALAPCYIDPTTGKALNSDADAAGKQLCWGVATHTAAAGEALTLIRRGVIDGLDLSALNYGASVFVSNNVGRIADAAGTQSVRVGHVIPVMATTLGTAFDKVLMVECNADLA